MEYSTLEESADDRDLRILGPRKDPPAGRRWCLRDGVLVASIVVVVVVLVAVFLAVVFGHSSNSGNGPAPPTTDAITRLPTNVVPIHYLLSVDVSNVTLVSGRALYTGSMTIDVDVSDPTSSIILNSVGLNITSTPTLTAAGSAVYAKARVRYLPDAEQIEFEFGSKLKSLARGGGPLQLSFNFQGDLTSPTMEGLYRSIYKWNDGSTHYVASTDFEPMGARKAWPCFDEPAYKANWTISVTAPTQFNVLSNMPLSGTTTPSNGVKIWSFSTSPLISTYLVALCASEYTSTPVNITQGGVEVRGWGPPDMIGAGLGDWALAEAAAVLDWFAATWAIPFPLPKLDLVSIPDFSAGAMENFGMITFRPYDLLWDPVEGDLKQQQLVSMVVAHEEAHQWFGDLVTMEWWSDLFLNEGFAEFCGFWSMAHLHPDWDFRDLFFADDVLTALHVDGTNTTHPIINAADTSEEVAQIFDAITYDKGSSLLFMLINYVNSALAKTNNTIPPAGFTTPIHNYLTAHAWGNAASEDLWAAFDAFTSLPISAMMKVWTTNTGYPFIDVTTTTTSATSATSTLSQHRFLLSSNVSIANASLFDPQRWVLPMWINQPKTPTQNSFTVWSGASPLSVPWNPSQSPLVINAGRWAFSRTRYDDATLGPLLAYIQLVGSTTAESSIDISGLIDDYYAFVIANYSSVSTFISIIETASTLSPIAGQWQSLFYSWAALLRTAELQPFFGTVLQKTWNMFDDIISEVGWTRGVNDTATLRYTRETVLYGAARLGHPAVVKYGVDNLFGVLNGSVAFDNDVLSGILVAAVVGGGQPEWEAVWNLYQTTTAPNVQRSALLALAQARQPYLISRTLQLLVDGQVRPMDYRIVIREFAYNPQSRFLLWDWVSTLVDSAARGTPIMPLPLLRPLIPVAVAGFSSFEKAEMMEEFFFVTYKSLSLGDYVTSALEQVRLNAQAAPRIAAGLQAWAASS